MSSDRLARTIAESLARHQSRGLVDGANGMADVVIHGRVDLISVAEDVLAATMTQPKPARKSWSGWFAGRADTSKRLRRHAHRRDELARLLESGPSPAETAIARLRMRELETEEALIPAAIETCRTNAK